MFREPTPDDNDAKSYDDRNNSESTHDEPHGTPPIIETPMNTHIGFSERDPAIDDVSEPVAIFPA